MASFLTIGGIVLMALGGIGAIIVLTLWVWATCVYRAPKSYDWDIGND